MDLSGLGSGTGGVWTVADAVQAGLTREQVRRRLERGEWQHLRRGVMTDAGVVPDPPMRAWAAVLATGGLPARAAGRTTVRLLHLPLLDDDPRLDDVAVPPGIRHRSRATLHVAELGLAPGDRVRISGCPSVSLLRALPRLANVLSYEGLVCLLDAALHRQRVDEAQLQQALRRYAGQPGAVALRRAVADADGRAESPAETLARLVLLPVVPGLVPQVRLRDRSGRVVARFDLGDPVLRLAVEVDGRQGHAGMAARDHQRDRVASALGWTTERCTWSEVRHQPVALQRRVAATAARLAAAA